jgi:hypothetical protein
VNLCSNGQARELLYKNAGGGFKMKTENCRDVLFFSGYIAVMDNGCGKWVGTEENISLIGNNFEVNNRKWSAAKKPRSGGSVRSFRFFHK